MKEARQAKILEIIATKPIETQEELMKELEVEGMVVTQATISRDIKELGLTKIKGAGDKYCYAQVETQAPNSLLDRKMRLLRNSITEVDFGSALVVMKTIPGGANAAASAIDSLGNNSVVGTLAGDDTVLIILRDSTGVEPLVSTLKQLIEG